MAEIHHLIFHLKKLEQDIKNSKLKEENNKNVNE